MNHEVSIAIQRSVKAHICVVRPLPIDLEKSQVAIDKAVGKERRRHMIYNTRAASSVPPSMPVEGQVSMKVSSG